MVIQLGLGGIAFIHLVGHLIVCFTAYKMVLSSTNRPTSVGLPVAERLIDGFGLILPHMRR